MRKSLDKSKTLVVNMEKELEVQDQLNEIVDDLLINTASFGE